MNVANESQPDTTCGWAIQGKGPDRVLAEAALDLTALEPNLFVESVPCGPNALSLRRCGQSLR